MSVVAVLGLQWGDEGKGKICDWLASQADLVARYQGGDNDGVWGWGNVYENNTFGVESTDFIRWGWDYLDTEVDAQRGTATTQLTHFSRYVARAYATHRLGDREHRHVIGERL